MITRRLDIVFATSSLARFSASPREGHLARVLRVFGYLKKRPNLGIIYDLTGIEQAHDGLCFNLDDLRRKYPDANEEIDPGFPTP